MRKFVIDKCLYAIKKYDKGYSNEKLEEIEYGLTGLYMTISKSIIIFLIAYFLGIFWDLLIFMIFYNIIRSVSFGIHATKSLICLVTSTVCFLGATYLSKIIFIPINIKLVVGAFTIMYLYLYSPADTKKRPIVSQKRRDVYKFLSTFIALIFTILSLTLNDNFMSNSLIFTLVIQCVMVSPITYKLTHQSYDNYKTYLKEVSV